VGEAWKKRVGPLLASVRREGHALFVSQAGTASRLTIEQYDGGSDAKYLVIAPRQGTRTTSGDAAGAVWPLKETIGYRPEVAGTDIIYDVTAEAMQGKARPFEVRFDENRPRVFALLPVQVEAISARIREAAGRTLEVEFRDAAGDRLQAVLPFHLEVRSADGRILTGGYFVTQRDGRYAARPDFLADLPRDALLVIRSQLTGWEESVSRKDDR
jgi:hypothetical protein